MNAKLYRTLMVFVCAQLQASAVTIIAGGEIIGTSLFGNELTAIGESFEIIVTYDDALLDSDPSEGIGQYLDDNLSLTLNLLGSGASIVANGGVITVTHGTGQGSEVLVGSNFEGFGSVGLLFVDGDSSFINSDALPTSFGEASDYSFAVFFVLDDRPTGTGDFINIPLLSGGIEFLAVPEPSPLFFFGVSLSAIVVLNRKRTKRCW